MVQDIRWILKFCCIFDIDLFEKKNMDTSAEKLELIQWIAELQDASILAKLWSIKEDMPVTDAERISIENGLEDFRKGKVHSHLQVKKRYEKWL